MVYITAKISTLLRSGPNAVRSRLIAEASLVSRQAGHKPEPGLILGNSQYITIDCDDCKNRENISFP